MTGLTGFTGLETGRLSFTPSSAGVHIKRGSELVIGGQNWFLRRLANIIGMYYPCDMSTITIPLPDEDLAFLRAWSKTQGTSVEAFLAQQASNLRQHLQRPLQPLVVESSDILSREIVGEEKHREHLEIKHR